MRINIHEGAGQGGRACNLYINYGAVSTPRGRARAALATRRLRAVVFLYGNIREERVADVTLTNNFIRRCNALPACAVNLLISCVGRGKEEDNVQE